MAFAEKYSKSKVFNMSVEAICQLKLRQVKFLWNFLGAIKKIEEMCYISFEFHVSVPKIFYSLGLSIVSFEMYIARI